MATARLASFWPTMCLSSSDVISLGVIMDMKKGLPAAQADRLLRQLKFFDANIVVGVDADIRGNAETMFDDLAGGEFGIAI